MTVLVVLHRPQNVINIAVVLRAMKNFGFRDLRLVAPEEFDVRRIEGIAHNTGDLVQRIQIFETLDDALADCTFVAGLSARPRTAKRNQQWVGEAVADLLAKEPPERPAIVFGPEDKGLTNEDLDRCHRIVTIPTSPDHPSLNLGQAATVTLYELFKGQGIFPEIKRPRRDAPPATREQLEILFHDAERALTAIEFFKSQKEAAILRSLRELAHRAPLDARETKLLRAMCLEVIYYLDRSGVGS